VTLHAIAVGKFGLNLFNLLDVGLFFGLAYGIYRNSRTCAIVLLVYHLGNRFGMYQATGNLTHVFGLVPIASAAAPVNGVAGVHGQEDPLQARHG
jgi:hypothetical protein